VSTYSKARCVICGTLFYHENGTAPVCDAICWEAYLRHKDDEKSAPEADCETMDAEREAAEVKP
jgi:hypothetical protein